jgi:hypothetical protein
MPVSTNTPDKFGFSEEVELKIRDAKTYYISTGNDSSWGLANAIWHLGKAHEAAETRTEKRFVLWLKHGISSELSDLTRRY